VVSRKSLAGAPFHTGNGNLRIPHDLKNAASAAFRVASFFTIIASQAAISPFRLSIFSFSSWIVQQTWLHHPYRFLVE
jgi:hypothetical protein